VISVRIEIVVDGMTYGLERDIPTGYGKKSDTTRAAIRILDENVAAIKASMEGTINYDK
jgi:hypothetical protein